MAPVQADTVAEAMPKLVAVLSTVTLGFAGWAWKMHERRIDKVEEEVAGKADAGELGNQRRNIGKLFDEMKDVREKMDARFSAVEHRVSTESRDLLKEIHASEGRLLQAMRETVLDRRERPR